MAFVNEQCPELEQARIDELRGSIQRMERSLGLPSWWTIDRERNAFLVATEKLGGGYEGTQETFFYVLNWKEHLIHFSGDFKLSSSPSLGTKQVMSWRIHQLQIPTLLKGREGEVRQLIYEALDAKGFLYHRDNLAAVNVDFDFPSQISAARERAGEGAA